MVTNEEKVLVEHEQSETGKKLQYAKGVTGEKCKAKILQHLKLHHEIMQYIKRVEHEKNTI